MVSKIETGAYAGAPAMLEAIRRTLEYAGVEFTNGDAAGVDRALAKEQGCVLESFFMTMVSFDNVAVIEAPDDETIAKYVLTLGSEGNLRTLTLKVFAEETFRTIIGELA